VQFCTGIDHEHTYNFCMKHIYMLITINVKMGRNSEVMSDNFKVLAEIVRRNVSPICVIMNLVLASSP
jgi:hypothetical protein